LAVGQHKDARRCIDHGELRAVDHICHRCYTKITVNNKERIVKKIFGDRVELDYRTAVIAGIWLAAISALAMSLPIIIYHIIY
jgi:hypothetical protein